MSVLVIGATAATAQTNTPSRRQPTIAELERAYLDGRITAKEFQQYLKEVQPNPQSVPAPQVAAPQAAVQPRSTIPTASTNSDPNARALEMLRRLTGKTNDPAATVRGSSPQPSSPPPATKGPPPTVQPANPPAEAANPAITDAESKINELLKMKEAREKATQSATNTPASNAPKSKRQRLDDLLKQFIDGKMSEPDYKQRREKIIAEPD
jgi:hypothetical protein